MPKRQNAGTVKETRFKGRPVLELYQGGHNTPMISFGVGKASLILEHVEAVRGFCAKNQAKAAPKAA